MGPWKFNFQNYRESCLILERLAESSIAMWAVLSVLLDPTDHTCSGARWEGRMVFNKYARTTNDAVQGCPLSKSDKRT